MGPNTNRVPQSATPSGAALLSQPHYGVRKLRLGETMIPDIPPGDFLNSHYTDANGGSWETHDSRYSPQGRRHWLWFPGPTPFPQTDTPHTLSSPCPHPFPGSKPRHRRERQEKSIIRCCPCALSLHLNSSSVKQTSSSPPLHRCESEAGEVSLSSTPASWAPQASHLLLRASLPSPVR